MATVPDLAWNGSIPSPNNTAPQRVDLSLTDLVLHYSTNDLVLLDNAAMNLSLSVVDNGNGALIAYTSKYNLVVSYGQSLSINGGLPRLSTTAVTDNLCFGTRPANTVVSSPLFTQAGPAAFAALTSAFGAEVPVISLADRLRRDMLQTWSLASDSTRMLVANAAGTGGQNIAELSKGASPEIYASVVDLVDKCMIAAAAVPGTCAVATLAYFQGEADYVDGTSENDYYNAVQTLYSDYLTDLMASSSQTAPFPMFISQANSVYDTANGICAVGNAQIRLGTDGLAAIYLIGPNYGYKDAANHPTSDGYRNLGEKMAQVVHKVQVLQQGWKPLYCINAQFRRKHVLLTMHTPEPPLQVQQTYVGTTLTTIADYGFEIYDDDGPNPIVAITLYNSIIDIECTRPLLTAKHPHVQYAGVNYGGEGNICDSDTGVSYYADSVSAAPYPMWNWLCSFDKLIESDE